MRPWRELLKYQKPPDPVSLMSPDANAIASSSRPLPRVAFLGLGLMGAGMAGRLAGAGFSLAVYNRDAAKARSLAALGARVAATPAEAAAGAELIFSMVADDAAARAVWLGDAGALAAASRGAVLVECSTVSVGWIRELDAAAQARGAGLAVLDAPVTGSRPHAAAGELAFLVGGPAEALAKARPALAAMGRAVLPTGPAGSGARLKLINNFLCGVQVAAFAEALVMIERGGLDRAAALGVLTGGAPGSPLVRAMAERMGAASPVEPQFHLALMAKDLAYARDEAAASGLELRTAGAALERFATAVGAGLGSHDLSAVVESLRGESFPPAGAPNFTP